MEHENSSGMGTGGCCECSDRAAGMQRRDLERYAVEVRRRIEENVGGVFNNMSPAHASVIVDAFLETAKKEVCIFCRKLAYDVYGSLTDTFRRVLSEGQVKVRVVTHAAYEELESKELAEILCSKGALRCSYRKDMQHFIIADACRYRLETDAALRTAVVCASTLNDARRQNFAKVVGQCFSDIWNSSTVPGDKKKA